MRPIIAPLLVLLALCSSAGAEHCEGPGETPPKLLIADKSGTLGGDIYVNSDMCQMECCPCIVVDGITIYQESNGFPGQQRGDEIVDDTCHAAVPPDRMLWWP